MFEWISSNLSLSGQRRRRATALKAAQAIMTKLDAQPPKRVVGGLTLQFNALREANDDTADDHAFMRLDEYAQRALTDLWESLLSGPQGLAMSDENWTHLTSYCRSLHAGYWFCLQRHTGREAVSERDHADAIVMTARAMAALAKYMLLLRMRYRQADHHLWAHVDRLVDWSEQHGHLGAEMELYPGTAVQTSMQRELLIALLIEVAPTPNLLPPQMNALDRLLRRHPEGFRLSSACEEETAPFGYEPDSGKPPQRWLKQMPTRPGVRFFGLGGAYRELCAAKDEANASRQPPGWLGATGCSMADYREMLERVVSVWSLQPPCRRQRRELCEGEILVAHDWAEIRRLVNFSELAHAGHSNNYESTNVYGIDSAPRRPMDQTLSVSKPAQPINRTDPLANLLSFEDMLDAGATEVWPLKDLSEDGLGAVTTTNAAWAKVGMMIAFRHAESPDWQLALIRRLNRAETGELVIGMTKVPGAATSARLRLGAVVTNAHPALVAGDPASVEYNAVLIRDPEPTLFIPAGAFDRSWKYTLYYDGRRHVVKMEKSVERGLNFERVEISMAEQARAA